MNQFCDTVFQILSFFSLPADWLTRFLRPKITLSTLFCDASLNAYLKWKVTENIFNHQEWHPNHAQLQIFIQANISVEKKLKSCKEQPHLVSGHFVKVF